VKGKAPLELNYRRDPSRPGGGVFVATGKARADYSTGDLAGTVENGSESEASSEAGGAEDGAAPTAERESESTPVAAAAQLTQGAGTPMVASPKNGVAGFGPLAAGGFPGGAFPNVNPAMNTVPATQQGHVQVMNVLDVPTNAAGNTLQQFAMADTGFLEGIPDIGMFDWGAFLLRSVILGAHDADRRRYVLFSFFLVFLGQWDSFFARFPTGGEGGGQFGGFQQPPAGPMQGPQLQQPQQRPQAMMQEVYQQQPSAQS
jgi:hypothetical protein